MVSEHTHERGAAGAIARPDHAAITPRAGARGGAGRDGRRVDPAQLPTWTVTSADRPGRIATPGGDDQVILTGTRWTTLTKLPVALSGGIIENRAPVAGDTVSTTPWNDWPG